MRMWNSKIDKNITIKVFHMTLLFFPFGLKVKVYFHVYRFKMARHDKISWNMPCMTRNEKLDLMLDSGEKTLPPFTFIEWNRAA